MLKNFFKITFRNFSKNKSYVLINLLGLGMSLACCIVGYLNSKYSINFDKNHLNHERIFKVHAYKAVQDDQVQMGITPLPLGGQFKDRYSSIIMSSRYASSGLVLKKDLKVFDQNIGFAEDDFLEMFTFPLKYGSRSALQDPSKILLRDEIAQSYFGDINPTGETIYLIDDDGVQVPMTVGGVFEKIPRNSSILFSGLTHLDNYFRINKIEVNDWSRLIAGTFVMTSGEEPPSSFIDDLNQNYISIQNESRQDFRFSKYYLVQLTDLGSHVTNMAYNWLNEPPPPPAVVVPFMMAGLMLLIACFNFTNTSIAISSKRLKEIGIRKVMGGSRKQLIAQFMGENLVLSFLSMLVAVLFALFLVPMYNALWEFIDISLNLVKDIELYVFLLGLLVLTSVIAGGYPSLYISHYQPVKILRGSLALGGTNWFSKTLLGLQYMLTIIALISSLAFANNANYQATVDIGFEKENILGVRVNSMSEYENYMNLVQSDPSVERAVGSSNHIGWWHSIRNVKAEDKEIEASLLWLGINYAEIMDLEILQGRYFDPELYDYDRESSVIVNEEMVKAMDWEEPLGKVIVVQDTIRLNVVGVMNNFYQFGFFEPVLPSAYRLCAKDAMNFVVIKSNANPTTFYDEMEAKWYEVVPTKPFNAQFQSEAVDQLVSVNRNIMKMFVFLGLLALLLSSIGLYTLVSLNMIKKVKEIGVRKVLGATLNQILVLMNKQFFWLLLIFTVIGAVLSYLAIDALMASIFTLYQTLTPLTVLVPFVSLLAIAIGLASIRIFKTANQNPVTSLRYE
ncbi:MAG: FtsX-like permease family protein [Bacteroidota bacterium]